MRIETTAYTIRCDKCGKEESETTFSGVRIAVWAHPAPSLEQRHTAMVKDFCTGCTPFGFFAGAATQWN